LGLGIWSLGLGSFIERVIFSYLKKIGFVLFQSSLIQKNKTLCPPPDCLSVDVLNYSRLRGTASPCQAPDKMPHDSVEQSNAMRSRKTELQGFAGKLQVFP